MLYRKYQTYPAAAHCTHQRPVVLTAVKPDCVVSIARRLGGNWIGCLTSADAGDRFFSAIGHRIVPSDALRRRGGRHFVRHVIDGYSSRAARASFCASTRGLVVVRVYVHVLGG